MWNSAENLSVRSASFREDEDDEEALRWAALERLPTYNRVRKGIFRNVLGDRMEIEVDQLQLQERKVVLDRLVNSADDDWEKFFDRMRRRFDRFIFASFLILPDVCLSPLLACALVVWLAKNQYREGCYS